MRRHNIIEIVAMSTIVLFTIFWIRMYLRSYPHGALTGSEEKIFKVDIPQECKMHGEFQDLDFVKPSMRKNLCRSTLSNKKSKYEHPMCVLPTHFKDKMLNAIIKGSEIVRLNSTEADWISLYIYKSNDYISNYVRETGSWEPELVRWILEFALKLPTGSVTFMDMGSNIGVYSTQAAKLGLPVVALDANLRNLLRLQLSLRASSLKATLVWNFISREETKRLGFLSNCTVSSKGSDKADLQDTVPVMSLRSERLASLVKTDTIVMKMDIQGGETDFLLTSGRIFADFTVAALLMEWSPSLIRNNASYVIAQFFTSKGYRVWRMPDQSELHPQKLDTWGDIDLVWVHRRFLSYVVQPRGI